MKIPTTRKVLTSQILLQFQQFLLRELLSRLEYVDELLEVFHKQLRFHLQRLQCRHLRLQPNHDDPTVPESTYKDNEAEQHSMLAVS